MILMSIILKILIKNANFISFSVLKYQFFISVFWPNFTENISVFPLGVKK